MHCPQCGVEVVEGAKFCHRCAAPLDGSVAGRAPASGAATATAPLISPRAQIADEPEQVLWEGGFSSKAMLGDWIAAGIVSLAMVIGSFYAAQWQWYVLAVIPLIWLGVLIKFASKKYGVHYRLTNQRLVHQRGILSRATNRIEAIDIDDVTVNQGFIERLMNVGRITIVSDDSTDRELQMDGIENAEEVSRIIDKVRRAERVKRGVHIDSGVMPGG
jgi:membrane protein YdbS with pleckstrin-like domain